MFSDVTRFSKRIHAAQKDLSSIDASASARPVIKYRSPFAIPGLVAVNMETHGHPLERHHRQHEFLVMG